MIFTFPGTDQGIIVLVLNPRGGEIDGAGDDDSAYLNDGHSAGYVPTTASAEYSSAWYDLQQQTDGMQSLATTDTPN